MSHHPVIPADTMVLPNGMTPDDPNRRTFAVHVRWMGRDNDRDLWCVTTLFPDTRLSVETREWCDFPDDREPHYFPTYDDALLAAIDVVDSVTYGNRTWAQLSFLGRSDGA